MRVTLSSVHSHGSEACPNQRAQLHSAKRQSSPVSRLCGRPRVDVKKQLLKLYNQTRARLFAGASHSGSGLAAHVRDFCQLSHASAASTQAACTFAVRTNRCPWHSTNHTQAPFVVHVILLSGGSSSRAKRPLEHAQCTRNSASPPTNSDCPWHSNALRVRAENIAWVGPEGLLTAVRPGALFLLLK